jgi:predicted nucleic acid-binding protein
MILIDSSVFLKHFLEGDRKAHDFLKGLKNKAIICDIIVNEVLYILMKQHVVNKYELGHYDAIDYLKKPDIFQEAFEKSLIFTRLIKAIECEILPNARYSEMVDIMEKYNLLPNDALIAATCRAYGIAKVASFDSDLENLDFIEITKL